MTPPRKTGKFSTSFLDVILGALGAFFLLLILVSVSRRGDAVEEGTRIPGNILSFNVVNQPNFVFDKHIRFFAAICDEKSGSLVSFSSVFFSETLNDGDEPLTADSNGSSRLKITRSGGGRNYEMTLADKDKDAPNVLICVWLADLPSSGEVKSLLADGKGSVPIRVIWTDKEHGTDRTVTLNRDNGFASVFFLKGRETREDLVSKAIETICYRNFVSSPSNPPNWEEMKKEKNLDEMWLDETAEGRTSADQWYLCYDSKKPLGKFNRKDGNDNAKKEKPNVFFFESFLGEKETIRPDQNELTYTRELTVKLNDLARATSQTEIFYVAWGKRAVCVRLKEEEQRLYVCPREDWKNVSEFVESGILIPINEGEGWYQIDQTAAVKRYLEIYPDEADGEVVLKYLADVIASPIYETNSPLTQVSPLVVSAKLSGPSK